MSIFYNMRTSGTALTAERLRMDVISNNIANSETTRTPQGGPYQRRRVVFSSLMPQDPGDAGGGVEVSAILTDTRPGNTVHDPTNPDANAQGDVTYPNVDISTEMIDMMSATRAYEANVVALQAGKTMAEKALTITQG